MEKAHPTDVLSKKALKIRRATNEALAITAVLDAFKWEGAEMKVPFYTHDGTVRYVVVDGNELVQYLKRIIKIRRF